MFWWNKLDNEQGFAYNKPISQHHSPCYSSQNLSLQFFSLNSYEQRRYQNTHKPPNQVHFFQNQDCGLSLTSFSALNTQKEKTKKAPNFRLKSSIQIKNSVQSPHKNKILKQTQNKSPTGYGRKFEKKLKSSTGCFCFGADSLLSTE